ncbi:MAG: O-antigen ligase family protein [Abditibacteriales bacterium]|nr:O-antigen ligase family protein [Abditibacteriales bacterium]
MSKIALATVLLLVYGVRRMIANPIYGLYAFVFVISIQPQQTYAWDPVISRLRLPFLMGLITLIGYLRLRERTRQQPVSNPHNVLMILFWVVIVASCIYNQLNPFQSKMLNEFTRSMVLYFMLINLVDNEEKLVTTLWVWVGVYTFMSYLAMHKHSIGWYRNCKPYMWYNKNLWGLEITETLPLAAGLVWNVYEPLIKNRIAMRWLAVIPLSIVRIVWWHEPIVSVLILGIAAVLFWSPEEAKLKLCWRSVAGLATLGAIVNGMWCRSRSAYLATVLCVGLIAIYELRRVHRTVLIAIVIAAAASYVGITRITNTYNSIINAPATDGSAQERLHNWRLAVQYMTESPVLGIGPEQFIARTWGGRAAHNGWAQVMAELGVTGLMIFAGMFLLTLFRCVRNLLMARRLPKLQVLGELSVYLGIAYVAWAFGVFFQGFIYYHHIYMLAGLTVAAETIIRRHLQEQKAQEQIRTAALPRVAPAPVLSGRRVTVTQ